MATGAWTPETDALQKAVGACLAAVVVLDDEPESRLRNLVDDVVNARLAATPPSPDLFAGMSTNRKAVHLWADHVIARSGANARTVLVLSPPDAASQPAFPNSLDAGTLAVRLDEPTTRLPWQTADPALFHATTTAWNQWAITESSCCSGHGARRCPTWRRLCTPARWRS